MTTETANLLTACFEARSRWETHFDDCRTCGTPRGLCAEGSRLHTEYASLKTRIEQGR